VISTAAPETELQRLRCDPVGHRAGLGRDCRTDRGQVCRVSLYAEVSEQGIADRGSENDDSQARQTDSKKVPAK